MTQPNKNPLIEINQLTFHRGERAIFDDVSLTIKRGEITAIMGPSGIGKTTLLRLIGGQILPDNGEIWFDGDNIPQLGRAQLYDARKKMSMLFQSGALFSDMTIFDNVAYPLREHTKLSDETIRIMVLLKLEAVGLRGASQLMPSELSGGMARRAALARAIALDPELVMYDEPFTGQDPISMGVLVDLIKNLNHALGATSIIVSHDVPEVLSIADYVYLLADGKILAQGTPSELLACDDPKAQQFLQGKQVSKDAGGVPFHFPAISIEQEIFQ